MTPLGFLVALQFLTVLPVPLPPDLPGDIWGRSMAVFPLVGLVLAGFLLAGRWLFALLFPPPLAGAALLAEWLVLTGALHFDGFVDCCDALLAPRTPEERLAILKDPHAGSFGLAGGALLLLVKYAALTGLAAQPVPGAVALVVAPVLGRWAMVYATVMYPYARPGATLGGSFASHAGRRTLAVATGLALLIALAAGGWRGLLGMLAAWTVTWLGARWVRTRIPGLTGDVYGALNESVEMVLLLLLSALSTAWR